MADNTIRSMTGFGKAETSTAEEKIVVELRSLNSKQLDMNLKLPQVLKELEMELRKIIGSSLERGKVELIVIIEGSADKKTSINRQLAADYAHQLQSLSEELSLSSSDLFSLVLKMPEVLQTERSSLDENRAKLIKELVERACIELNAFRSSEGRSLGADLKRHIESIAGLQQDIIPHVDTRVERIRERIQKNLEQQLEGKDYDASRFEQELVYYLEKYDVSEEMTRLQNHLEYFKETMDIEGPVGKKLGFIAQEIGREINTLGAKSYDADMQKIVVRMKDDLEKIKEQTLNVL